MARQHRGGKSNGGANLGFEEKLWAAADKMRGSMDPGEYKHVALGLIFLKYISDAFQQRYDHLMTDFGLPEGLVHHERVSTYGAASGDTERPYRVQILDPAAGTGTFLYSVISQVHDHFIGNEGMWPSYVGGHLLPRLHGFELLMAPYAIAHLKLGLQLAELGCDFASDQRLNIYLTNTLEEAHEAARLPAFAQAVAQEANAAGKVKTDVTVMVVLGNPPYYGHSANEGDWIRGLLRGEDSLTQQPTHNYFQVDGRPLGERNPKWLNADYVKFIRFAQWRIERTGQGILGFVTNHSYLDNPTFRGMRQTLMDTFDVIYVYDLHGSSRKRERAPDGGPDENVFDNEQGVAVCLMVKKGHARAPS